MPAPPRRLLLVLFGLLAAASLAAALYEDQVGLADWHQKYIGKVKHAVYHSQKSGRRRVVVLTEENVIASLDLRSGDIFWRHVIEKNDPVDQLSLSLGKYVVTLSSRGSILRAWNLPDGQMIWETNIQTSTPSKPLLHVLSNNKVPKDNLVLVSAGRWIYAVSSIDGVISWGKEFALDGLEIKQVVQSPENDIVYVVGIAGSSKIALYQLNAKTGEIIKDIQESFPGGLCGEAVLGSHNVLVALDETRSALFLIDFKGESISYNKVHILDYVQDLSGMVKLLPLTSNGIISLQASSSVSLLKLKGIDGLEVIQSFDQPAAVSDVLTITEKDEALAIVQHVGSQIEFIVKFTSDVNNEVIRENINIDEHRGSVAKIFLNNYVRTDKSHGFRALVVMEDHSLLLVQQGEVVWSREDGLASIVDVTTSELPVEKDGVSVADVEHNLFEWLKYWKAKMEAYIQAQGFAIWEKVYKPYQVPENDEVSAANIAQVEANSKARNLIIQGLGRSDFDRVVHLKSAYEVWKALCDYHEGSSTIKEVRQDMYKKDYMRFEMKPGESIDDLFARFNKILSNLRAVNVTYTDAENARQLLGALDMSIWEMKVTSIRESTVMSTLTLDVLYSKLKTHELDVFARKNNGNKSIALASQSSKSNGDNSSTSYALSSLSSLTDEQLEQLPEDDLALLSTRFTRALQNVRSRKRGNFGPQRCYECGDLNHIRPKCPKFLARFAREENEKEEEMEKEKKKNKKKGYINRKVVHRVLSALEQINLSDVDTDSEDDTPKSKKDLIGLCLMASSKSSTDNDDLDSDNYNEGHMLKLKGTLMLANSDELAAIQALRRKSSEKNKMTRDHNGFRKLLIVLTKAGKVIALHTGDGHVVWSNLLPSLRGSKSGEMPSALRIYQWQVPHHRVMHENPSVLVCRSGADSVASGVLSVLDSYSGEELNSLRYDHSVDQIIPLTLRDSSEQRLHLIVDSNSHAHLYPRSLDALNSFLHEMPNLYLYSVDIQKNVIRGYSLQKSCNLNLDDEYCFSTKELWYIIFPSDAERIAISETRKMNEVVHTQAKIIADQDVMYKYLSKNLVFVATVSPKAAGEIGSAAPEEAWLVAYLIDAVTGRILHRVTHHGAQGPVHAVVSENWVVYHYFNLRAHRFEMAVIEIYDQSRADNKDVMKLILGKHNLSAPITSYARPEVMVKSQSYFFTHSVKAMAVTQTAKGITSKQLLIGTIGDQVLALDKRFLDPRRSVNPTQQEKEEGIIPLTDALPIIPQSYVTHSLQVEALRGIVAIPAKLESTTLVFTYGVDLFYTRLAPSRTYDSLTDEFSYALLLLTIAALVAAIIITWIWSEKKELKDKWR